MVAATGLAETSEKGRRLAKEQESVSALLWAKGKTWETLLTWMVELASEPGEREALVSKPVGVRRRVREWQAEENREQGWFAARSR
jgi:hypothetical protein